MTTNFIIRNPRLLILNPNSSHSMTHGVEAAVAKLHLSEPVDIYAYTAPASSPGSINDGAELEASTRVVLEDLPAGEVAYDGIIVACYSVHPLVKELSSRLRGRNIIVTGIFEASILTSLALISPYPLDPPAEQAWGIVTTGKFWEDHLADGVRAYLGQEQASPNSKFAGVFSTGLNAGDFHGDVPPEVIRAKLDEAAKGLLRSAVVGCVVMGCAGMAGLEDIIRAAAISEYGKDRGNRVSIVDGVQAAVLSLAQTIKAKRMFQSLD
jgi:Asp/Glu/hydantoin racemase